MKKAWPWTFLNLKPWKIFNRDQNSFLFRKCTSVIRLCDQTSSKTTVSKTFRQTLLQIIEKIYDNCRGLIGYYLLDIGDCLCIHTYPKLSKLLIFSLYKFDSLMRHGAPCLWLSGHGHTRDRVFVPVCILQDLGVVILFASRWKKISSKFHLWSEATTFFTSKTTQ